MQVLDLLDICPGCAHLSFVATPADDATASPLGRCQVCGVPVNIGCPGTSVEAWQESTTAPWWRDPYLARTSMHLCRGCDRIVQDERAWQLRKHGHGSTIRCRVCQMRVPAETALPLDGPIRSDGLLAETLPRPAEAEPYEDDLVERVRAGLAGAAAQLGERHRRVRDVVGDRFPRFHPSLAQQQPHRTPVAPGFGRHFCAVDLMADDDDEGDGYSSASCRHVHHHSHSSSDRSGGSGAAAHTAPLADGSATDNMLARWPTLRLALREAEEMQHGILERTPTQPPPPPPPPLPTRQLPPQLPLQPRPPTQPATAPAQPESRGVVPTPMEAAPARSSELETAQRALREAEARLALYEAEADAGEMEADMADELDAALEAVAEAELDVEAAAELAMYTGGAEDQMNSATLAPAHAPDPGQAGAPAVEHALPPNQRLPTVHYSPAQTPAPSAAEAMKAAELPSDPAGVAALDAQLAWEEAQLAYEEEELRREQQALEQQALEADAIMDAGVEEQLAALEVEEARLLQIMETGSSAAFGEVSMSVAQDVTSPSELDVADVVAAAEAAAEAKLAVDMTAAISAEDAAAMVAAEAAEAAAKAAAEAMAAAEVAAATAAQAATRRARAMETGAPAVDVPATVPLAVPQTLPKTVAQSLPRAVAHSLPATAARRPEQTLAWAMPPHAQSLPPAPPPPSVPPLPSVLSELSAPPPHAPAPPAPSAPPPPPPLPPAVAPPLQCLPRDGQFRPSHTQFTASSPPPQQAPLTVASAPPSPAAVARQPTSCADVPSQAHPPAAVAPLEPPVTVAARPSMPTDTEPPPPAPQQAQPPAARLQPPLAVAPAATLPTDEQASSVQGATREARARGPAPAKGNHSFVNKVPATSAPSASASRRPRQGVFSTCMSAPRVSRPTVKATPEEASSIVASAAAAAAAAATPAAAAAAAAAATPAAAAAAASALSAHLNILVRAADVVTDAPMPAAAPAAPKEETLAPAVQMEPPQYWAACGRPESHARSVRIGKSVPRRDVFIVEDLGAVTYAANVTSGDIIYSVANVPSRAQSRLTHGHARMAAPPARRGRIPRELIHDPELYHRVEYTRRPAFGASYV